MTTTTVVREFTDLLRPSRRAEITANETSLEYARYRALTAEGTRVPLQEGTLLALFATLADGAAGDATTGFLAEETHDAYVRRYGAPPPYNWTNTQADMLDVTNNQPNAP